MSDAITNENLAKLVALKLSSPGNSVRTVAAIKGDIVVVEKYESSAVDDVSTLFNSKVLDYGGVSGIERYQYDSYQSDDSYSRFKVRESGLRFVQARGADLRFDQEHRMLCIRADKINVPPLISNLVSSAGSAAYYCEEALKIVIGERGASILANAFEAAKAMTPLSASASLKPEAFEAFQSSAQATRDSLRQAARASGLDEVIGTTETNKLVSSVTGFTLD